MSELTNGASEPNEAFIGVVIALAGAIAPSASTERTGSPRAIALAVWMACIDCATTETAEYEE